MPSDANRICVIADTSNDAAFCAKLEAALLDELRTTSIQGINSDECNICGHNKTKNLKYIAIRSFKRDVNVGI